MTRYERHIGDLCSKHGIERVSQLPEGWEPWSDFVASHASVWSDTAWGCVWWNNQTDEPWKFFIIKGKSPRLRYWASLHEIAHIVIPTLDEKKCWNWARKHSIDRKPSKRTEKFISDCLASHGL